MSKEEPDSQRYLIIVWYLGTNFHGSQRQPNLRTVEGEIIHCLTSLHLIDDPQRGKFHAGMRTDKGVHAKEAAFCFTTTNPFYPRLFDSNLPKDIGLVKFSRVPEDFHPRWECKEKEYRYFYPMSTDEQSELDLVYLQAGLEILEGTHDFRMFSKTDRSKPNKYAYLTMDVCRVEPKPYGLVFIFQSQSFLWEQIRRMITFLIKLAHHDYTLKELTVRLRENAIQDDHIRRDPPSSPEGLILWALKFSSDLEFELFKKGKEEQAKFLTDISHRNLQIAYSAKLLKFDEN